MTIGEELDGLLETLKRHRDELHLQAHLFKAEARDEWEKVEDQWEHLQGRAAQVGAAGGEAGEDIAKALSNLGQEILEGYRKIRRSL